jgi:hypothetical protein
MKMGLAAPGRAASAAAWCVITEAALELAILRGRPPLRNAMLWKLTHGPGNEAVYDSDLSVMVTRHSIGLPSAVLATRSSFITLAHAAIPRCLATFLVAGTMRIPSVARPSDKP